MLKTSSFHWIVLTLLSKFSWPEMGFVTLLLFLRMWFILESQFQSIDLNACLSLHHTAYCWSLWLHSKSESGSLRPPVLRLHLLLFILCISTHNVGTDCQCTSACWDFDKGCIEFIDQFGENCHLDNTESSSPWTWTVSPFI